MLNDGWVTDPLLPDSDLWDQVSHFCRGPSMFQLHHVYSHQNLDNLKGIEHWICSGNQHVDNLATAAFDFFEPTLLEAHGAAARQVDAALTAHKEVMAHYVRVGQLSIRNPTDYTASATRAPMPPALDLHAIVDAATGNLPLPMQWEGADQLLLWLRTLHDPTAHTRWVSWVELLLLYQIKTENLGVVCRSHGQARQWGLPTPDQDVGVRKLASSLGQYVWNIVKLGMPTWKAVQRRPANYRLHLWLNCVPIRIPHGMLQCVDDWIDSHNLGRITRLNRIDDIMVAI